QTRTWFTCAWAPTALAHSTPAASHFIVFTIVVSRRGVELTPSKTVAEALVFCPAFNLQLKPRFCTQGCAVVAFASCNHLRGRAPTLLNISAYAYVDVSS